uniref:Classical arabinogalactan protein 9-like n=1 Tax=Nicotiana sylvestris TaxID=4096 RepID=A0A1U7V801_NICSY|nr:PREDICTED: classical arabinogalactan protein 9-like [Nicotiana sylvestris]
MDNEQSSPSPVINTTSTSPPPLTPPPETHFFTIPDTTVPIPVSSLSPVTSTPPSNPVSLPCVANPTSPPFSEQTKNATPQASEVSEEDSDQYLNSSVLGLAAPTESPENEATLNIMVITAKSLINEGASPLPES